MTSNLVMCKTSQAEVTGMPSSKPPSLNAFAANHPLVRGKFIKSYTRLLRLFFRESALLQASILYVSCRDRSQLNRAPRRCVGAMTMPFCRCRHEGATCAALPRPRLPKRLVTAHERSAFPPVPSRRGLRCTTASTARPAVGERGGCTIRTANDNAQLQR